MAPCNRRQFVHAATALGAGVLAGCLGGDDGTQVTETVVVDVGPEAVDPDVEPSDAAAIEVDAADFDIVGDDSFVVRASVHNASDRTVSSGSIEATLYDANEFEDDLLDARDREAELEGIQPDESRSVRFEFEGVQVGTIDYYSVTATAQLDPASG